MTYLHHRCDAGTRYNPTKMVEAGQRSIQKIHRIERRIPYELPGTPETVRRGLLWTFGFLGTGCEDGLRQAGLDRLGFLQRGLERYIQRAVALLAPAGNAKREGA